MCPNSSGLHRKGWVLSSANTDLHDMFTDNHHNISKSQMLSVLVSWNSSHLKVSQTSSGADDCCRELWGCMSNGCSLLWLHFGLFLPKLPHPQGDGAQYPFTQSEKEATEWVSTTWVLIPPENSDTFMRCNNVCPPPQLKTVVLMAWPQCTRHTSAKPQRSRRDQILCWML